VDGDVDEAHNEDEEEEEEGAGAVEVQMWTEVGGQVQADKRALTRG
jgi:hypothetical protein